jgi:aspartyl-tRNA synthetase
MSFVQRDDIMEICEGLMIDVFKGILNIDLEPNFPMLTYEEAMARYGSDKPDTRFAMEIVDVGDIVKDGEFKVFNDCLASGGIVCGLALKGGAKYSRKQIDDLGQAMVHEGAKGVASIKVVAGGWESPLAKFFPDEVRGRIDSAFGSEPGDLLLLFADEKEKARTLAGSLRLKLAAQENLIPDDVYKHVWIVDFPLLEFDEEEQRYVARHHPFTSPMDEDIELMEKDPGAVRAKAYDLVLNGYEIAGGSIRIHTRDMQNKMFSLLNISEEEAKDQFGFLLDAFVYGAPPHGGIAFGFDRMVMVLAGEKSIRDVIAFPKTNSALSLLDGSPSQVSDAQLRELGLKIL